MTIRKIEHTHYQIGELIKSYRLRLHDLPKSRSAFIEDRSNTYFGYENWISEKTLANYETGKNIPSLENIKKLALALEIDPLELVAEILKLL